MTYLNPDGTYPRRYVEMEMSASTCTSHEYTKAECLRHILLDTRHLLSMKWWQDKGAVKRGLREWLRLYDEAKK